MSVAIATPDQTMIYGETRNIAVSFIGKLEDSGELLTGTPTIVEQTSTSLTLSNKAVNTAALTLLGETVAIGKAVQFKVTDGTAGSSPRIRITVSTDSVPAQTLIADLILHVIAPGA